MQPKLAITLEIRRESEVGDPQWRFGSTNPCLHLKAILWLWIMVSTLLDLSALDILENWKGREGTPSYFQGLKSNIGGECSSRKLEMYIKKTIPPASWYVPMRRRLSSMRCQWRSSTLSEPFRTYDMFSHPMMPCEMMDDCSIHMPCVLQWFANT